MNATRVFAPRIFAPLAGASRASMSTNHARASHFMSHQQPQRRRLTQDHSDLGGVGGSEPPGPQPNKHNWIAGGIAVTAVLIIGWRMRVAKLKQKEGTAKV